MSHVDNLVYAVITVDNSPYLVRVDPSVVEFVAKLPQPPTGGYTAASISKHDDFEFHAGATSPPLVFRIRQISKIRGVKSSTEAGLRDESSLKGTPVIGTQGQVQACPWVQHID